MQLIQNNGEPIYLEDMCIDKNDIIESGIADGAKAEQILEALLDLVHRQPELNSKKALLKCAEQYAKNPLMPTFQALKRWRR